MPLKPFENQQPRLEGRRLLKAFDGRSLFEGLDVVVAPGDSIAISGESGTGKSTILHILAGLEKPDAGQVLVNGLDVWTLSARYRNALRRRQIGLVFQAFYLLPHLTARQNIALPWVLDGQPPDACRIDELLHAIGLPHRANALPSQLSGGEQQRVAIARALALKPAFILADEPTGNLDPRNAEQVLDLLTQQTSDNGHALVMVTHSERAASRLKTHLRLQSGQLQAIP